MQMGAKLRGRWLSPTQPLRQLGSWQGIAGALLVLVSQLLGTLVRHCRIAARLALWLAPSDKGPAPPLFVARTQTQAKSPSTITSGPNAGMSSQRLALILQLRPCVEALRLLPGCGSQDGQSRKSNAHSRDHCTQRDTPRPYGFWRLKPENCIGPVRSFLEFDGAVWAPC